ncbi:MAG TPA: hypothetical protein VF648_21325 [Pyrinomonadaceae bacterium]|jgi:hypothetical protein
MVIRKTATAELERVEIPTKDELLRRARFIAAVGKFTKLDDSTYSLEAEETDGAATKTTLKQNAFKQISCNCALFLQEGAMKHRNYRCEHKLALRIYKMLPEMPENIRFNPLAQTVSELVGTEQLTILRKLAKNLGLKNIDQSSRAVLGCGYDECSREAAQFLIDYLIEIQGFEAGVSDENIGKKTV